MIRFQCVSFIHQFSEFVDGAYRPTCPNATMSTTNRYILTVLVMPYLTFPFFHTDFTPYCVSVAHQIL